MELLDDFPKEQPKSRKFYTKRALIYLGVFIFVELFCKTAIFLTMNKDSGYSMLRGLGEMSRLAFSILLFVLSMGALKEVYTRFVSKRKNADVGPFWFETWETGFALWIVLTVITVLAMAFGLTG